MGTHFRKSARQCYGLPDRFCLLGRIPTLLISPLTTYNTAQGVIDITAHKQGFLKTTEGDVIHYGFTVVPFGQGLKDMSPLTKRLMALVLERNVANGGHPVLRGVMDNIFVQTNPAGNI